MNIFKKGKIMKSFKEEYNDFKIVKKGQIVSIMQMIHKDTHQIYYCLIDNTTGTAIMRGNLEELEPFFTSSNKKL